jgi:hypothetical protein
MPAVALPLPRAPFAEFARPLTPNIIAKADSMGTIKNIEGYKVPNHSLANTSERPKVGTKKSIGIPIVKTVVQNQMTIFEIPKIKETEAILFRFFGAG